MVKVVKVGNNGISEILEIQAFPFSLNSTSCTRFKALQISFFIFVVKDQGHDHLHHGDRDRGHGEVG